MDESFETLIEVVRDAMTVITRSESTSVWSAWVGERITAPASLSRRVDPRSWVVELLRACTQVGALDTVIELLGRNMEVQIAHLPTACELLLGRAPMAPDTPAARAKAERSLRLETRRVAMKWRILYVDGDAPGVCAACAGPATLGTIDGVPRCRECGPQDTPAQARRVADNQAGNGPDS